jgi:hypothetical protein
MSDRRLTAEARLAEACWQTEAASMTVYRLYALHEKGRMRDGRISRCTGTQRHTRGRQPHTIFTHPHQQPLFNQGPKVFPARLPMLPHTQAHLAHAHSLTLAHTRRPHAPKHTQGFAKRSPYSWVPELTIIEPKTPSGTLGARPPSVKAATPLCPACATQHRV